MKGACMTPPRDEILTRFASRLGCSFSSQCGPSALYSPASSSLPSVLSSNAGVSQQAQGRSACTLPCLSHRTSRRGRLSAGLQQYSGLANVDDEASSASSITFSTDGDSPTMRDVAHAQLLARALHFGRTSLPLAPAMLLGNFLSSFGYIIESEMCRAIGHLIELYEGSKGAGANANTESRDQANREAAAERAAKAKKAVSTFGNCHASPIVPVFCVIEFQTGLAEDYVSLDAVGCGDKKRKSEVVSLPLFMNVEMKFAILDDHVVTASFSAPGTITGAFVRGKSRPDSIDVTLDTTELLRLMRKSGRRVVRDALTTAGYDVASKSCVSSGLDQYDGQIEQGASKKSPGRHFKAYNTFDETAIGASRQPLDKIDEMEVSPIRRSWSSSDVLGIMKICAADE